MTPTTPEYGMWLLVILNTAVFVIFAFSFTKPKTTRDWRSFGAFSGFLLALFTEMYGFPLTIYLFSGWLSSNFPNINWLAHDSGHLLEMMFGWTSNPHFGPFHLISTLFIGGGFILLSSAWKVLFEAQKSSTLAATGIYSRIRHPQYVAFVAIMLGFLFQWPTILTLIMFPILVFMYVKLARREEKESVAVFGKEYEDYMEKVPAFIPSFSDVSVSEHHNIRGG